MRSVVGLTAVVAAATFYLYLLSSHLPAGPRRRPDPGTESENVETAEEEPSRWMTFSNSLLARQDNESLSVQTSHHL